MTLLRVFQKVTVCDNGALQAVKASFMPRGSPRLRTLDGQKNQVGGRVRTQRNHLKLTQDALCGRLAEVTGGSWIADRRDIFRIEDGRRIVSDLEIIALSYALECKPGWLLLGNEELPALQFQVLVRLESEEATPTSQDNSSS